MNRPAIDTPIVPPPPISISTHVLPSLDEIYLKLSVPDQRMVIRGVDWAFYEQLVDQIPDGANIRIAFDGKDVEITSPSALHDGDKKLFGQLVEAIAQELEIPYRSAGSTTWKRPAVARGIEADECYFFAAEKLAVIAQGRARRSNEIADYPNPDLAIEVDISPSRIDRSGIYAALGVAEVWRFEGEVGRVVIERLQDDGTYRGMDHSGCLPVAAAEIRRWVVEEDASDESAWARRLRAWVRSELAPRLPRGVALPDGGLS